MRILVASPIDPGTIEELGSEHDVICQYDAPTEVLKELIRDRDLLIFRSGVQITAEVMESGPELKYLLRAGSGLDNLDVDYVRRRGLELTRIPTPSAQAVAEMAFALMLALSRRLLEADRSMREGRWAKYELYGTLLSGKVLGIVGAGNTGSRVGEVGVTWGMEVLGCVEHPSAERANVLGEKGIRLADFEEVISRADYVSVHVPYKESTHYLFNAEVFSRMKPGSFLINLGRGGVVDEHALYEVLTAGDTVRGAGLDVHEVEHEGERSPLADLSNVVLTPHIGATVVDTQREIGRRIYEIVDAYGANEES
ncbi:MAG: NAD(P)-dependent oxidoreductase [Anaerolineae bacterium]|jgi:D-3-phosphoglycerate dehydrogenase